MDLQGEDRRKIDYLNRQILLPHRADEASDLKGWRNEILRPYIKKGA